ncbi:hypothetical protein IKQ21_07465 [bacterium]|nr:hypothetical protein [bacterium]
MRVQGINNYYLNNNNNKIKSDSANTNPTPEYSPSFRGEGGWSEKLSDFISKMYAKYYAKPMYNQQWLYKASKKMTRVPGKMTAHMATLGSFITSGVYIDRTLKNKDLDNEKKKTLAINQGLCFLVPTACAYTVDHLLKDKIKEKEYRYAGRQLAKISKKMSKMSDAQIKDFNKLMGDRLKGFSTLATLITFTLIYRYVTPVLMTPIANWCGEYLNNRNAKKKALAEKIKLDTQNQKVDESKISTSKVA